MSAREREPVVWPYDDAPFDAQQVRDLLSENEKLRKELHAWRAGKNRVTVRGKKGA